MTDFGEPCLFDGAGRLVAAFRYWRRGRAFRRDWQRRQAVRDAERRQATLSQLLGGRHRAGVR